MSCSTLGLKHALPLDDRKELLHQLMAAGCPEVKFPRMAVFNWGARVVHAALMILCRAEPGSPVRLLRDENGLYTAEYASKVLLESFQALYHTQEERQAVVVRLLQNCYEKQDLIIEEAKAFGYDPMQVEDKVPLMVEKPIPRMACKSTQQKHSADEALKKNSNN